MCFICDLYIGACNLMKNPYTIATLGSHSALQILKGAKDEGFQTLVITTDRMLPFYKTMPFIDSYVRVDSYADFPTVEKELLKKNVIVIPHGTFVASLGIEGNKKMQLPYYGNKKVLDWEADRNMQRKWLEAANLTLPGQFKTIERATFPVIVKHHGAAGGKGYFYAKNKTDFQKKIKTFGKNPYTIQEYVIGVPFYIHYFYSPLTKKLEIMSMDRRYETNVDGLGRIPSAEQKGIEISPSYVVVGNSELVLRESMLSDAYAMGNRIIDASKKLIDKKGLYGPFCLETVITPDQKFYAFEISCRIVAGTNIFVHGSAYSWLYYNEPMSTGRRIAREIKNAIKEKRLKEILY